MSGSSFAGRFAQVGLAVVAAFAAGSCMPAAEVDAGREREEGKGRKQPSTLSYFDQTKVDAAPTPGAAPGFDAERVWSGFDDWEPAVAADPSTSDIYQMTTRYNGPKPCNGCPLPAMIFRRSRDGGATWDPDRFMPTTKAKQNDPQVEVASDGSIYVVWIDGYDPGVRFTRSDRSRRHLVGAAPVHRAEEDAGLERQAGARDLGRRPRCLHRVQLERRLGLLVAQLRRVVRAERENVERHAVLVPHCGRRR